MDGSFIFTALIASGRLRLKKRQMKHPSHLKHASKTLETYKKRQIKYLKHASKTLTQHPDKTLKTHV